MRKATAAKAPRPANAGRGNTPGKSARTCCRASQVVRTFTVVALIYVGLQVAQRQRRLREIFDVIDDDREMVDDLEGLVRSGRLRPVSRL